MREAMRLSERRSLVKKLNQYLLAIVAAFLLFIISFILFQLPALLHSHGGS